MFIFAVLCCANVLLWFYASHRVNPWPILRGQVVGCALANTLLLVGIWRRQMWARYVLIVMLWYVVAIFGISALFIVGKPDDFERMPVIAVGAALAMHVGMNVLLIRSRKIQHLAHTAGSGG